MSGCTVRYTVRHPLELMLSDQQNVVIDEHVLIKNVLGTVKVVYIRKFNRDLDIAIAK